MNKKILIVTCVVIVAIITIMYLEQGESKVSIVNNSTSKATVVNSTSSVIQSANQAPTPSITVTTDKPSYSMGDAIIISGIVKSPTAGTPVTILFLDPNNLLFQAERISVSQDGIFQTTIMTTPSIWKLGGTYAVSVQYGSSDVKAQKTFYFTG
ncbi:hypothetical protein DYY67_1248 [Candidatus Nitrosotalea sp. TS]|uniref:hypothetical protein n=1 Tax=Candidatus Nitrosotalea sp. TS TaxID=2341020 RepID=UPI00140C8DBC|nr:hypothetical protein [Candidatus Nitrosotalea sp. TS]NHI04390.1 hypothetical protein [Candidatus Nitrosotalea sp. TS]